MSLTKEQIKKNAETYLASGKKYGFINPELETLLGGEFFMAPASTMLKLHNAFNGGLVAHILELMKKAYDINLLFSKQKQELVPLESLVKASALCQIGKAHLYVPNPSKWHRDNQGKMYEFNEDASAMTVGERSLFYALSCGVDLNEEECVAILNHDKKDDDLKVEYHNSQLGHVVRNANRFAIIEEKI